MLIADVSGRPLSIAKCLQATAIITEEVVTVSMVQKYKQMPQIKCSEKDKVKTLVERIDIISSDLKALELFHDLFVHKNRCKSLQMG